MVTEGRYKVKLSEKLPASDAGRLPTWEQCKAAVLNEDETALERFIYEMEPPRLDDAVEFRAWLEKVVEADSQEIKRLRARVAELEHYAEELTGLILVNPGLAARYALKRRDSVFPLRAALQSKERGP